MNKLGSLFIALIVFVVSGCVWQRIPAAPEYILEVPIPLRMGVIFGNDTASTDSISHIYGLAVIKGWNEMRLFDSLIYPYQEGDRVDAVIRITITGGWEDEGLMRKTAVNLAIMLTLGLAGNVVGRNMTVIHDALVVINKSSDEIVRHSVQVTSTIELGVGLLGALTYWRESPLTAEHRDRYVAGYELQRKRIAFELAKKIRADRQNLLSKLGKFQVKDVVP